MTEISLDIDKMVIENYLDHQMQRTFLKERNPERLQLLGQMLNDVYDPS